MSVKRVALLPTLLLLFAAGVVATRLEVSTDMGAFLPRSSGAEEAVVLEQLRSGASARVLLLALEGTEAQSLARLSSRLGGALRASGRYEQVLNGELHQSAAKETLWFRYRYLLQQSDLSVEAIRQALQQRLQEVRSPLGIYVRQTLAEDPTAAFRDLLRAWQGAAQPERRRGVWFDAEGRALLLARTRAPAFDLDAQEANITELRRIYAALEGSKESRLIVSGAPAIAVASRDTIQSEAQQASIAASVAVALILLIAYRSWRLWLLSALPLGGAILVALAVTTLIFGTVHGITIAFGITLLGVAIDYPIHLFSHLRPGEQPRQSLRRIWPTLRLGVFSTAIGFSALLFTRFDGLVQLGLFAISGLLAAAVVTCYLLPPLIPTPRGRGESSQLTAPVTAGRGYRLLLAPLLLLLALAYLAASERPLWEDDLTALSPIPESLRQQDRQLRDALPVTGLSHLLLLQAGKLEMLLQAEERLQPQLERWQEEGLISGYAAAASRLPSAARQRQRQAALPSEEALQAAVAEAASNTPFRAGALQPFVEAVASSRQLQPLTLEQVRDSTLGLPLNDLLFEYRGQWWGVIRLAGLEDAQALQQRLAPGVRYVNLKAVTQGMLGQFRHDALRNLAWGALAILLLIALGAGSGRRALAVALPLAAAVVLTLALLHALGERYTLFHLTALLLVVGIGIDYGLFFSRAESDDETLRTRHALAVCATSTVMVFAILSVSRLPVLHALGVTVLLGVSSAYLLARLTGVTMHTTSISKDNASG